MKCLVVLLGLILVGCTSPGVQDKGGEVFYYEGIYLKHISINGDQIYLVCDENGKLLANHNTINSTYSRWKNGTQSVAVIEQE